MALSKSKILRHAGSVKTKEIHVKAWADEDGDDVVLVRGMTLREFEINQASSDDGKSSAKLIARCVVDESGLRVFSDADVDLVAELPVAEAAEITNAIFKQSGLIADDNGEKSAEKAVSDAEGNSEATPGS